MTTDSADSAPLLERELSGRVLQLALNRPAAANAFSADLYLTAAAAFDQAAADDDVSVVVLTGRGKAFRAGTDLQEMAQVVPEEEGQPVGGASASSEGGSGVPFNRFMEALIAFPKPLIAAVNGAGVGLGLTMLLHCDLVLMSTRRATARTVHDDGRRPRSGQQLPAPPPDGCAARRGRPPHLRMDQRRGGCPLRLGFRVYDPEELLPKTMRMAAIIATKPLASLIATKRLMRDPEIDGVPARPLESDAFTELLRAPEMRELVLGQLPATSPPSRPEGLAHA